jgi:hypothetical protein
MQIYTKQQVIDFHKHMSDELGIRYCSDAGMVERVLRVFWGRLDRKVGNALPEMPMLLRPMALKRIVYLPYVPGCHEVTFERQINTAIHEATHCMRIKEFEGRVSQWYGQYITNPRFRAIEEALAQLGVAEFEYWQTGSTAGLNLSGGYCIKSREERKGAQMIFDGHIDNLFRKGRGFSYLESSAAAIRFFKD